MSGPLVEPTDLEALRQLVGINDRTKLLLRDAADEIEQLRATISSMDRQVRTGWVPKPAYDEVLAAHDRLRASRVTIAKDTLNQAAGMIEIAFTLMRSDDHRLAGMLFAHELLLERATLDAGES